MWLIPVLSCTSVRSLCRQNCCTTWKTWKKTASPSTSCLYWVTTFRPERSSRVRPKRHRGQFCCVNFNYMFHFLQNQTTTTSNFIVHSFLSLQESVSSVFVSFFPPPESVWKAGIWKPGKHWRFTWWGEKQQQQQHVVVLVPQLLNNSCLCVRLHHRLPSGHDRHGPGGESGESVKNWEGVTLSLTLLHHQLVQRGNYMWFLKRLPWTVVQAE